jgi:hypothetical protein
VALCQPEIGGQLVDPVVDRLALEPRQLADRAGEDRAGGPAAVERRIGVLEDHLERAFVLRRPAGRLCRQGMVVELQAAPGIGALDAEDRLRQRRLPRSRLPDQAEGLAIAQLEAHADQGGHIVAALVEGLRHAFDGQ